MSGMKSKNKLIQEAILSSLKNEKFIGQVLAKKIGMIKEEDFKLLKEDLKKLLDF
jgi:hypothetical protein